MSVSMQYAGECSVDSELTEAAGFSIQAHEQLCYLMSNKLKDQPNAANVLSECRSLLDNLRELKSKIEGTNFKFQSPTLCPDKLTQLKHLTVSHTPATLFEATKAKLAEGLSELFEDQVKRLVYACILTCPWFAGTQTEVSAQARNNVLFVVYVCSDEQFFSLATPHEIQLGETVHQGVLFATEVRHFCSEVVRGNVRCIEALTAPPENLVFCSPEWLRFVSLVEPRSLLGKGFVDRCLGQAVGGLVKKMKVKGKHVPRDHTSLANFCDSFRLLTYVDCAIKKESICSWTSNVEAVSSRHEAKEAFSILKKSFQGDFELDQLLDLVLSWKAHLDEVEEHSMKFPASDKWNQELGQWLAGVRLDGASLSSIPGPSATDQERLTEVLTGIGMERIDPSNVLMVCEAGSKLYDLALPTSDTDYIVVYKHSTQQIISSYMPLKESHDNRGRQLDKEAGAYEARMFCEMLLKGAVNIIELLYAGEVFYSSEAWKQLVSQRALFHSEQVVLQYIGYVKTHLKLIDSQKHAGKPREGKLFYSILHKLLSLENYVEGKPPVVKCSVEQKDYIMKVRRGPLEGELSPEKLHLQIEQRLEDVRKKLRTRKLRLREFGDYRYLQSWLLSSVRGIHFDSDQLKMSSKPLVAR